MIIVYSTYSSELFQNSRLELLSSKIFCSTYSSELFLAAIKIIINTTYSSAPLTLLSCFGRTAHFFKVQLAKKTQLLLMHSYYMAYSCINCQILLHRIILTCSFSSANPTAILWVLNVRTPW